MDIEISFSPVDDGIIPIANAQLLITNNSDNAPSLHYWMDGLGTAGIPTGPVDLSGTIPAEIINKYDLLRASRLGRDGIHRSFDGTGASKAGYDHTDGDFAVTQPESTFVQTRG